MIIRISGVLFAFATLAACSSSGGHPGASNSRGSSSGSASSSVSHGITIYHDGFALPACNIGVAPAPCQRTVSPVEVQFSTPTGLEHGGGYDAKLSGGSVTVTEYVDSRQLYPCPADDGYACMADDHNVTDDAGTWEIRY